MTHSIPPGDAPMSGAWCDRSWHDGACCPGSIRQWHQEHDLLPPEPHGLDTTAAGWSWAEPHERGDHSACDRNCEHTL